MLAVSGGRERLGPATSRSRRKTGSRTAVGAPSTMEEAGTRQRVAGMEPLEVAGAAQARSDVQVRVPPTAPVRAVRVAPLLILATLVGFAVAAVVTGRLGLLSAAGVLWPPLFITGVLALLIGPSDTLVVDRVGRCWA